LPYSGPTSATIDSVGDVGDTPDAAALTPTVLMLDGNRLSKAIVRDAEPAKGVSVALIDEMLLSAELTVTDPTVADPEPRGPEYVNGIDMRTKRSRNHSMIPKLILVDDELFCGIVLAAFI
jgi:hypothetical protein